MFNLLTLFAADNVTSTTDTATSVCKCVETSLFGRVCSTGDGTEIFAILSIVVQVLTAGIGILAVIGIVYFGIQYLTAGDDPGKVKKAKSRLLAIVIGLASYAVIYAALYFLLPNFNPRLDANFKTCTESEPEPEHPIGQGGSGGQGGTVTQPVATTKGEKIAEVAVMMAWPYSDPTTDGDKVGKCVNGNGNLISYGSTQAKCDTKNNYKKSTCCANSMKPQNAAVLTANGIKASKQLSWAKDCAKFVCAAVKYSKVDSDFPLYYTGSVDSYLAKEANIGNGKWERIENKGSTKNLKPGDIFVYPSRKINGSKVYGHTMIYVEDRGYKNFNMTEASLDKRVARSTTATFKLSYNGSKVSYHIYRIKE